jgi:hypothetical protein
MSDDLESYETNTKVFIVKIWLEESSREGKAKWRGHITDITSGDRQYIEDLIDIVHFIIPYLEKLGVTTNWFWQFVIRLKQKRSKRDLGLAKQTLGEKEHWENP